MAALWASIKSMAIPVIIIAAVVVAAYHFATKQGVIK